jgi:hypothetical protein
MDCYQRGLEDAITLVVTTLKELGSQGLKSLTIDEAVILVTETRAITEAAATEALPEPVPINGS